MFRITPRLLPLLVLLALYSPSSPAAVAQPAEPADVAPGEVIVRVRDGASPLDTKRAALDAYARVGRTLPAGYATLEVAPGDEQAAIARLLDDPAVELAEYNALRTPQSIMPTDPLYVRQWNLQMIQAPIVWETTRGAGITIAVLDTGVAFEDYEKFGRSPQLANTEFVFPFDATENNEHPNDRVGHGTHVTGTLVQDWDDVGVAGIVPEAWIMPVRVCEATGCKSDALAAGVYWAVNHGADVITISLGGPSPTTLERDAFAYAEAQGVVVVASAGNGGGDLIGDPQLQFPARYETVISVGALDRLQDRAGYSNYGEHEGEGGVHVMAPGGSTHQDLDDDGHPDSIMQNTYAFTCSDEPVDYKAFQTCGYYGTSMASPHVSGVVAMLLSAFPGLTPADVRRTLVCSSLDLGPPGVDVEYGSGLVRAAIAVKDSDKNGIADCADGPLTFRVIVGKVQARPGEVVQLSVDGYVPYPGLRHFNVALTFDPALLEFDSCSPRDQVECEQVEGAITFDSELDNPIWGHFRIAYFSVRALGDLGSLAPIQLQVEGNSAQAADIEILTQRHPGSVRVVDPESYTYGDLDCDNIILPADVLVALRQGVTGAWLCTPLGDPDCSGEVNSQDGMLLLAHLVGADWPQSVDCPPIGFSVAPPATPSPPPESSPEPSETPSPSP